MELEIKTKSWQLVREEGKPATIGGEYVVEMAGKIVSTTSFNTQYDSTVIKIPPELLSKINDIDVEVKQAIIDNFSS